MVLMEFTFPAGRYHATPWGRHVNEGAVEWPPSPWRLLRSLVAVYWRKRQDLDLDTVKSAVAALASSHPHYVLPDAVAAHTRHYMPLFKEKTAKIFDAFLHVEREGALLVCWPELNLDPSQQKTLADLLEGLGYLGRAESWVEARLLESNGAPPSCNAFPATGFGAVPPEGLEAEKVLCLFAPDRYQAWREAAYAEEYQKRTQLRYETKCQQALDKGKDPDTVKVTKAEAARITEELDALFPDTLFEALHADTGALQSQGWSAAPGSEGVLFFRPVLGASRPTPALRRGLAIRPTVIRVGLAPDTVSADTRPRIQDGLYLGEQLRRALMSLSRKIAEERGDALPQCAAVFSGKDAHGNPLADNHEHAFFLPCDDDGDGRIDHVLICARGGFSSDEIRAVGRLRNLWQYGGRPGLFVVYLGEGRPEDFGGFKQRDDQSPFVAESRVWRSHTPYVPVRHPKRNKRGEPKRDGQGNWIDSPAMQIAAELEARGLPRPAMIKEYAPRNNQDQWRHFATRRKNGAGARAQGAGMGFRIEFEHPLRGPLALGYGCHFGLGMFMAEADTS